MRHRAVYFRDTFCLDRFDERRESSFIEKNDSGRNRQAATSTAK